MAKSPMNDEERARLDELMSAYVHDPHERASVVDGCEGKFESVAGYVEQRLSSELPTQWRWLNTYVAHSAVGERWLDRKELAVIKSGEGDRAGVFVLLGKG